MIMEMSSKVVKKLTLRKLKNKLCNNSKLLRTKRSNQVILI
jgi:hypothetical protein